MPVNAGSGHSYGSELEMFVRPADGWQINGTLSLMNFKYDTINPLTGITLDMEAPFVNKIQASLGVQYEADLGSAGTLTPRFDVAYQSEFYYQAVNNPAFNLVPARALANTRLTYKNSDRTWEISLSVSNLFDKYYAAARQENIVNFGHSQEIIGRPREWFVSVKRSF
jgi:iron complex outermembrane receptor protein